MTALTKEQVLHIAKLARLRLTEEEMAKMPTELSSILQYVEMLNEVITDGVEPTAQVTGLETQLRDDVVQSPDVTPDELLGVSPLPIKDHQITTPHAHG